MITTKVTDLIEADLLTTRTKTISVVTTTLDKTLVDAVGQIIQTKIQEVDMDLKAAKVVLLHMKITKITDLTAMHLLLIMMMKMTALATIIILQADATGLTAQKKIQEADTDLAADNKAVLHLHMITMEITDLTA